MESLNWKSLSKLWLILGKTLKLHIFETAPFRLFPKMVDLKAVHKYYDVDGDGTICYNEFVNALADK